MKEIRDALNNYMGLGWTTMPCKRDKKQPMIPWREYQKRKPTRDEWGRWLATRQVRGLAILTGQASGIIVVDVDSEKVPLGLESTIVCRTRSGGWHFYYRYAEALRNTVKIDGSPVDFRGDGGLVMVPPTQYENQPYTWVNPPTKEAIAALPELPADVRKFLGKSDGLSPRVNLASFIGTQEGGRDDAMTRAAASLCNKYAASEWESLVRPLLQGLNKTFVPPLDENVVDEKFESAMVMVTRSPKKGGSLQEPKERVAPNDFVEYSEEDVDKMLLERREKMPLGYAEWDDVFDFPAGFYTICGVSGAGKGWFAIWLARRFFELHKKRTVFYSLEMHAPLVFDRLYQAWSDLTQKEYEAGASTEKAKVLLRQNAILVYPFGEFDDAQRTTENFQEQVAKQYALGYRVFMFDHLHEIDGAGAMETNPRLIEKWSKMFQQIAKKYVDCWFMVFVQVNSAAESRVFLTKKDMFGSKVITQKTEVFMSINRRLKLDENGEVEKETDPRVLVYIDKSRITSHQHFGRSFRFLETGNYIPESLYYKPISEREIIEIFPERKDLE